MKLASTTTVITDYPKAYAPIRVSCPSDINWIRPANGLNPSEAEWIHSRKAVVYKSYAEYLKRLGLKSFDVSAYLKAINQAEYKNLPSLGFAISGGGYASAYTGTGALRALDERLSAARDQRTGGLLQSLLYQTGLSGGSWPTVSFPAHDWPTADDIIKYWQPQITRPSSTNSTKYTANTTSIFNDLAAKFEAGFPITTADFFGRAWSYEFVPGPHGGVEPTFSGLIDISAIKNHQAPLPILHMTSIAADDTIFYGLQIPFENASSVSKNNI